MKSKITLIALTLLFCIGSVAAQERITLRGNVVDAQTQRPLVGASVSIVGTAQGVATGEDGGFTLQVARNAGIEVSFLGYETWLGAVDGRTQLRIELYSDIQEVDDVVVLGYGAETRKADLSVAASHKTVGEEVKSRSTDLISAMQGRIAGVTITGNGGDPLSSPSVTIRGMGSRGGDSPLYVVDGVSGAPFNQEDVVSFTVLKDAASAAIYGTNVGSGGVILVTTKKAMAGKTAVTFRANYGIQQAWRTPKVLNAEEYVKVRTDAAEVDERTVPSGINPDIYPYGQVTRTDWIDEIFRVGSVQRYALTINGGTEQLRAYASAEYSRTSGTLLNTYAQTLGTKLNVDFKLNDFVSLSEKLHYNYDNGQGGLNTSSHTGVTASAMLMPPSATVYDMDEDGNYILDQYGNPKYGGTVPSWAKDMGVAGTFGEIVNPVAQLKRLNQNRPNQRLFSTTSLVVTPWRHGLKFTSEFSASAGNYRYEDFVPRVLEIGKTNDQNSRTLQYSRSNDWLWENVLSYDNTFGAHVVSAMAGHSLKYNAYNSLSSTVFGFPNEDEYSQHFVNGTDWSRNEARPIEGHTQESMVSTYVRGAYSFDNRYFVTASIRRDASSKLNVDNNSGVFPAVSGAWKISSEKFFGQSDLISLLKLRASWGRIGNVNGVRNYSYSNNLAQSGQQIHLGKDHNNPVLGLGLTSIANKELIWETSEQTDLGLDIEFLRGELTLSADYFIKNTNDLIDEIPMPSVVGVAINPLGNVGSVQNRGFEFTLGYSKSFDNGLEFWADTNFSTLKSEVKNLGDREFMPHNNTIRAMMPLQSTVGQPWYSYYLIKTDGIFQSEDEVTAHGVQPNARPGDLRFVDKNGDGKITAEDRQYVGSYNPKTTYGLNAGFAYKNFDFNILVQGVAGNKIFNGVKVMTYAAGQGWNMSKDVLDSWGYNKNSDIPLISMGDPNGNFSTASDFFLEDGSYARIKNVTVGYTFPELFKGISSSLRVYVSADNLLTLTKYSGMDPEVGHLGLDGGTYPTSRIISLGANLKF